MNFNKLKPYYLKKSVVLNKNKWILLAIVVVCVGLYWYSKKNKEDYYNSGLRLHDWGGSIPPDGTVKITELSEHTKVFLENIFRLRDLVGSVAKDNEQLDDINKCKLTRNGESLDTLEEYKKTIIEFKPGGVSESGAPGNGKDVWGFKINESRATQIPCNKLYNLETTEYAIQLQIKDLKEQDDLEYINEIIYEEVIIYLGNSECVPSNDFLNKIWSNNGENLKKVISETFPGIKYQTETYLGNDNKTYITKDIIYCEKKPVTSKDNEDLSKTNSLRKCMFAGFYMNPPDDTLVFPLIQYSFLGRTNKSQEYKTYKDNFDSTIKLDKDGKYNKTSGLKEGLTTHKYTSEKILKWIACIRKTNSALC